MTSPPRIFGSGQVLTVLASQDTIVRAGLRRLIEGQTDLTVAGEAGLGQDVVTLVRCALPHVLVLDVPPARRGALEILREIEEVGTRTVLLTQCVDAGQTLHALRLGVRGLLAKSASVESLFSCVRAVARDQYWVHDCPAGDFGAAVSLLANQGVALRSLTSREADIVSRVVCGASNRQIAAEFGLSLQTVKNHLSNIYEKLGVPNRMALAVHVMERGILPGRDAGVGGV